MSRLATVVLPTWLQSPALRPSVHRDKRPWSVASVRGLEVAVHGWLTTHLTVIAAALSPAPGGTATGSVLLHLHFRVDGLAEKGHPCPVPTPGVEDPPPQSHMLFWCNAEISTSQTQNPKSITSRDWRNARGKGMTHKDQTTKRTKGGTMSLASQEINHGMSLCLYQNRA